MGKTIREALMGTDKSEAEIMQALRNAEALEFVKQIGIDT